MIKNNQQAGFTLIEMIVSVAIFSVVATITVGALLILIGTNQQLQAEQTVMTNLSFALDSMTREIRTGTNYYCTSESSKTGSNNLFNDNTNLDTELTLDANPCPNGLGGDRLGGVAFIEGGDSITGAGVQRILYFYDRDEQKIYRRVGSGDAQSIVSSGISITDMDFFVSGASGSDQPIVTIFIEAEDPRGDSDRTYELQTSITQRTLNI